MHQYNQPETAQGGTELQFAAWQKHVPQTLQRQVHISLSAIPAPKRPLKPHVFWAHQAADQPSVQNLADPLVQQGIDTFVFVSEWQRRQYEAWFGIPTERSYVMQNAIEPIAAHQKPAAPLRLLYTSTPFRGLDVLLDAWQQLQKSQLLGDTELHIYSGMALYGRTAKDERYKVLYEQARSLPQVTYHGVVSNQAVRTALSESHIFAYPCTWEETSCLALIEALSAGCVALVPDLAALPETAAGYARLYPYQTNKAVHAERFATELLTTIQEYYKAPPRTELAAQVDYFNHEYSWEKRQVEWEQLLTHIITTYGRTI